MPLSKGIWTPSNTWFYRPTRVHIIREVNDLIQIQCRKQFNSIQLDSLLNSDCTYNSCKCKAVMAISSYTGVPSSC